jgi:hypothetical protein
MKQIVLQILGMLIICAFIFIAIYNSYKNKNIIETLVGNKYNTIILLAISVVALYIFMRRDSYLPFLGIAHVPTSVFKDYQQAKFDKKITIDIKSKSDEYKPVKLVYWGASPSKEKKSNPRDAYGNYDNYGVSPIVDGKATMYIKCPASYRVSHFGIDKDLPKHIHYRVVYSNGLLSRVETITIVCP